MAEPLKQPQPKGDAEPRTARARSERDLGGRSKRPARGQRSSGKRTGSSQRTESRTPARPEAESRPSPRSEVRPRSGGNGSRPSRSSSGSPQRPRDVKAGSGARVLAPIALIIFAIACFTILSSQDSGSADKTAEKAAATKSASSAAKTEPTRSTYRVKPGDSFAAIAEAQGVDVQTLQELNPDIDPRALQPGQKLKLK